MLIRVIQPKRVAQLVNKDTANIANRNTIRAEPERPTISIKRLVIFKEHVRFNHVDSRGTPVGIAIDQGTSGRAKAHLESDDAA